MRFPILVMILITLIGAYLSYRWTTQQAQNIPEPLEFCIPQIEGWTPDDKIYCEESYKMGNLLAPILGRYQFGEQTISLDPENFLATIDEYYTNYDPEQYEPVNGLLLHPAPEIILPNLPEYHEFDKEKSNYFPIFLINPTKEIKLIQSHVASEVYAIQEAKGEDGIWYPIEMHPVGWWTCSGPTTVYVPAEGYLVFGAKRYHGSINTQLRVRFFTGHTTLISPSYEGSVNPEQFDISAFEVYPCLKEALEKTPVFFCDWYFYGGQPKVVYEKFGYY